MENYENCSWCHTANPESEPRCRTCGHDAHTARALCRCPECVGTGDRAAAPDAADTSAETPAEAPGTPDFCRVEP